MSDGIPAASAVDTGRDKTKTSIYILKSWQHSSRAGQYHQECVKLHPQNKKSAEETRHFARH